ncbi:putative Fe-S cluster assembly protein SufT, partial [Burkholderia pseudomallei]
PAGTAAENTQALGPNFTLVAGGQKVRLRGEDADALGKPPPGPLDVPDGPVTPDGARACVLRTLTTCYDPEIPVDLVELG